MDTYCCKVYKNGLIFSKDRKKDINDQAEQCKDGYYFWEPAYNSEPTIVIRSTIQRS
jgi:hypothetical protein